MSINQVINGKNRLVEHPNRYKLNAVSGQPNTYDFEKQPGEITENGTPYAKTILDKIDNVLSYLTPDVEKVAISETGDFEHFLIFPDTISGQSADLQLTNNSNGYNAKIECTGSQTTSGLQYATSTTRYYINIGATEGSLKADVTLINKMAQNTTYLANHYIRFAGYSSTANQYSYTITYDFKNTTNFDFHYLINGTGKIEASNNGTNWTSLATITTSPGSNVLVLENLNYRYIRYNQTQGTSEISVMYPVIKNETIYHYKNQFTLDNNGTTFVNNQRVLVETPNPLTPIYTYNNALINTIDTFSRGNSFNEINSILNDINNSSLKITTNNSNGFYDYDIFDWESYELLIVPHNNSDTAGNSTNFKNILNRTEKDSNYYVRIYQYYDRTYLNNTKMFFDYDFKVENMPKKLKINFSANVGTTDKCYLYESEDNINWNYVDEIISENIIENLTKRYYRIQFGNDDNTLRDLFIYYINWQTSIVEYIPTFLDGVTSNTLNGIDIPTLLQPSTKYELIYKEDGNKFELKNANVLVDIILEQPATAIYLGEYFNNSLEDNKLYSISISGTTTTTASASTYLNSIPSATNGANIGYFTTNYTPLFALFTKIGENILVKCFADTNDQSVRAKTKCKYIFNESEFSIGTHIIIKEVA